MYFGKLRDCAGRESISGLNENSGDNTGEGCAVSFQDNTFFIRSSLTLCLARFPLVFVRHLQTALHFFPSHYGGSGEGTGIADNGEISVLAKDASVGRVSFLCVYIYIYSVVLSGFFHYRCLIHFFSFSYLNRNLACNFLLPCSPPSIIASYISSIPCGSFQADKAKGFL